MKNIIVYEDDFPIDIMPNHTVLYDELCNLYKIEIIIGEYYDLIKF